MKKKLSLFALATALSAGSLLAQTNNIGIGTTAPDKSAVLDIQSADKGLLIPRMTLQQRNGIQNPANGLMIYQTDLLSGFYFFDGKDWKPLTDATSANSTALDADNWSKNGDAVTATNFIGTTNAEPLRFKLNNQWSGKLEFSGATANNFLGRNVGQSATGINNTAFGFRSLSSSFTGNENTTMGSLSMLSTTTGSSNVSIGYASLQNNTTGYNNMAVGGRALISNIGGYDNTAIGNYSQFSNQSGNYNVAIGSVSLRNNVTGNYNTAIGVNAGRNSTGSSNIYIGYEAGMNETGSNKLYIANSNTTTPLVYGDFSAKYVAIGDVTPAQRIQAKATGEYNLLVKGGILTEKVKVALATTADWADYVFEEDYNRMSLEEVEAFTKQNKHLPNVPSATEMAANGLDVSQTSKLFMEKIEELTLYMIELNKEVKALKAENELLRNKLK